MDKERYYCSEHRNIGSPDCKECIEKLRQLCLNKNALLIDEKGRVLT